MRIYNQVLSANDIDGLAMIPPVPTLTSAAAASGSVVQLSWTTPASYTQYIEVDRKTGANGAYAAIATLGGGTTSYMDPTVTAGVQYYYEIKAIDLAGTSPPSNALSATPPMPTVVGEYIFYNDSTFDGENGSSNLTDDNAIATDKTALLPGQAATFANYSSYTDGLNGIMVDVANLLSIPRVDDFTFEVGNNDDVSSWTPAPVPTYVNAYPGAVLAARLRSPSFGTTTRLRTNGSKSRCSPTRTPDWRRTKCSTSAMPSVQPAPIRTAPR